MLWSIHRMLRELCRSSWLPPTCDCCRRDSAARRMSLSWLPPLSHCSIIISITFSPQGRVQHRQPSMVLLQGIDRKLKRLSFFQSTKALLFLYCSAFACAAAVDKHRERRVEPVVLPHHRRGFWSVHEDFHGLLAMADIYSCWLGWRIAMAG